MRKAVKSYFRRLAEGYELGILPNILKPWVGTASRVYEAAGKRMRESFEKNPEKRTKLPFPVISVGNITWGGTGKTPLVEYLARRISEQQKTPLILTRGYSHDEVNQMKHHLPKVILGVGKNRAQVAKEISAKQTIDMAILDDGFQHWKLERNLDIVMINALNPFGNEKLIPEGILREPLSALARAGVIVISHVNLVPEKALKELKERIRKASPSALIVESYLEPLFFYRAKNKDRVMLNKMQKEKVSTFSGVGVPLSFRKLLASIEVKPVLNFEFTDHHSFTKKELLEIQKASESRGVSEIVTTEKDFYRSQQLMIQTLNPLVLATRLRIRSGEEALNEKIFRLAEKKARS